MAEGALAIDTWHLALSALFVFAAGAVSLALRLGLERKLAWASLRTVVQLLLVGYVLGWVFALAVSSGEPPLPRARFASARIA